MMADPVHRKPLPPNYAAAQPANVYGHSRTRTTSSNTFPTIVTPSQQHFPPNMQVQAYTSRRTPSNATSFTSSSGNGPSPYRQDSQDLRRSTSSRSGGISQPQPQSYVALMRRQKATVWCDRSQHEDPRILAQQKAAKMRAALEVLGQGPGRISTNSSGSFGGASRVTAKIRHHGKPGLVGYSPGDLVGGVGGVPMRLSASEVEGGDSDDDADSGYQRLNRHRRTGSGRSSLGSNRRGLTYSRQSAASSTVGRYSTNNSPPNEKERTNSMEDPQETPVPGNQQRTKDYFNAPGGNTDGTASAGSGSSGERADSLADLNSPDAARLASNSLLKSTVTRELSLRSPEELRRRGSVDERTMTMSAGRLYIANPDIDSD